ncbi:MAG TPA: hypothetical protein PLK94_14650 [Alphaproteobacteria bacterium]|nr:hypothetical protein [Alphaproteobacteria bacterium]HOO52512.1 hypothetical protein [Alphaproteobacteria bacterium]
MSRSSQESAIQKVANVNLTKKAQPCFSPTVTGGMTTGQRAQFTAEAFQTGVQAKASIQAAKQELSAQLDGNILNVPSSMSATSGLGMRSMATSAMIGAGLSAVNPVLGAAYMVADAVMNGIGGHAGIGHAAIDGGKSEFSSLLSKNEKGSYDYIDSMGDSYSGGLKTSDMSTQISLATPAPQNRAQVDAGMSNRAREMIDQLGEDEIRKQLEGTSVEEHRADQLIGSAKRFVKREWGENLSSMLGDDAMEAPKLGQGKPDWALSKAPGFSVPGLG